MNLIEIKLYGDAVLKKKAADVKDVNNDIKNLINNMIKAMYKKKGIGLAAPQVGVLKRIIIVDIGEGINCFINPKIIWQEGTCIGQEGCLSLPNIYVDIERSEKIVVRALNERGEEIQVNTNGLLARVIQHENDHLDGILTVDRISKKALSRINKKLEEIEKR